MHIVQSDSPYNLIRNSIEYTHDHSVAGPTYVQYYNARSRCPNLVCPGYCWLIRHWPSHLYPTNVVWIWILRCIFRNLEHIAPGPVNQSFRGNIIVLFFTTIRWPSYRACCSKWVSLISCSLAICGLSTSYTLKDNYKCLFLHVEMCFVTHKKPFTLRLLCVTAR
jgi:hypothetical protein